MSKSQTIRRTGVASEIPTEARLTPPGSPMPDSDFDWPEYYRRLAAKRLREVQVRAAAGWSENDPAVEWYWDALDRHTTHRKG